ncbi:hypothetical protein [Melittangium boletus]|uniref:hypothetical protein n=1 Tax=Melittangium boletus TaxID=83453 RepID=UPI003DA2D0E6
MAPAMFEPNDKKNKGGSRGGGAPPTPPEGRRVVQPLSVVRGNRPASNPLVPVEPTLGMDGAAAEAAEPAYKPAAPQPPSSTLLHLWAMLNQRQRWSSLVVVPSHEGGSGVQAVQAILEVAARQSSAPLHFLDAEGLELGASQHVVSEMQAYVEQGDRVIVLIDSIVANPLGLEVALAAERALLCVTLGTSDYTSARRTLDLIGKERFLGSVTLQPPSGAPKK